MQSEILTKVPTLNLRHSIEMLFTWLFMLTRVSSALDMFLFSSFGLLLVRFQLLPKFIQLHWGSAITSENEESFDCLFSILASLAFGFA